MIETTRPKPMRHHPIRKQYRAAALSASRPASEPDDNINIVTINTREELPNIARHISGPNLVNILASAENGDTQELFALYRDILCDSQIQSEFIKRKGAILGDKITLQPWNKNNQDDIEAKEFCEQLLSEKLFKQSLKWFLNATLYPIAAAEKQYQYINGRYNLIGIHRVHYSLLDWSEGYLRIRETDKDGKILNSYITPDDNRYIIHRGVDLPMPDHWGGPMRSLLFWWLLRSMSRQWWADFIERYGQPILKGTFSDLKGKKTLERAFAVAVRLGGLIISKGTEAEIIESSQGSTSASHESFIELCNREISKLIVGQTLSSNVQSTGMGNGTANLQGEVREDLRAMDATELTDTYRFNLFAQYLAINGLRGNPPKVLFGADSAAELASTINIVDTANKADLELTDEGITAFNERTGLTFQRKAHQSINHSVPFSALALSAAANKKKPTDEIAAGRAPSLSAAFTGALAPLKKIIETSETPKEALRRAEAFALSADISNPTEVINQALAAYAASGLSSS